MTEIEALMREWLEGDDPVKANHARLRIARGFAPPEDRPLPPLIVQARGLAAAVANVVTDVMAGKEPLAPDETVAARLAVCATCPERRSDGRCAGCGCVLEAAARVASKGCPLGKWPKPYEPSPL